MVVRVPIVVLFLLALGLAGCVSPSKSSTGAPPAPTTTTTTTATTTATTAPSGRSLRPLRIARIAHAETYVRSAFGDGWIDADHDCQNTRAEALINQSSVAPSFASAKGCAVLGGRWVDPWSGTATAVAHDLDIDHTVPLANAWRSGAWAWTPARRVAYANDLADRDHLVAIGASENRSKGDDGPEDWRPPDSQAWCRYALDWDRIKAKWHLTATRPEWSALQDMVTHC